MAEPDSNKQVKRSRPIGPFGLWSLAVVVGIVSGLGAAVFRGLIALFHNLFFLGRLSIFYDANAHTPPGPWGAFIILAPVIGAIGVAFLVKTFAPEAKGHGVPGGDGRDLLQQGNYSAGRRGGESAGIGAFDRQWRFGWTRRSNHSDRFGVRLDRRPTFANPGMATSDAYRRRRRRRNCRDLQHADRRDSFRGGNHVARGERLDAGAGGDLDCDCYLHWPSRFRREPVIRDP